MASTTLLILVITNEGKDITTVPMEKKGNGYHKNLYAPKLDSQNKMGQFFER